MACSVHIYPCLCGHSKGDHQMRIGQRGNYTPCCITGCTCDGFRQGYRTYRGIAYYTTWKLATAVRDVILGTYPDARVVQYGRGLAVQIRISGDYLGPDGQPSLTDK